MYVESNRHTEVSLFTEKNEHPNTFLQERNAVSGTAAFFPCTNSSFMVSFSLTFSLVSSKTRQYLLMLSIYPFYDFWIRFQSNMIVNISNYKSRDNWRCGVGQVFKLVSMSEGNADLIQRTFSFVSSQGTSRCVVIPDTTVLVSCVKGTLWVLVEETDGERSLSYCNGSALDVCKKKVSL